MWPLYSLSYSFVGITITSHNLIGTQVEQINTTYRLKTYFKQPVQNYEVIDGIIYNPSRIKQYIHEFLRDNNLTNAYIVIAIEDHEQQRSEEQNIQCQLIALTIPLHCIMITSYHALATDKPKDLDSSFNNLEDSEANNAINLYKLGKKIYENAT